MKCAGNYGVRRESFILHESSGGRLRRRRRQPPRGDACRSCACRYIETHVLRISNDADGARCRELFFVAPDRRRGISGGAHLDCARSRKTYTFCLSRASRARFAISDLADRGRPSVYRVRQNYAKRVSSGIN